MFRSTTMKLLPLVCLCVVTRSGITFADENGGVVVKEDSDAVLPCSLSTKENIETKLFDWKKDDHKEVFMYDGGDYYAHGLSGQDKQFEGRVSHFNDELKNGNASIKIRKTKVADSGNYTCFFPRLQPSQMFHIELVVGAAPEPSVTILNESKDWSLLQCLVRGASPRPKVEWRDSSGNILHAKEAQVTERGGSYDIILQTTVTKTDHYSCVVTQDQIKHHTEAETYVHINDPEESTQGSIVGYVVAAVVTFVITLIVGVIILAVLFATGRISCRKDEEKGEPIKDRTESDLLAE
ncbi:butyrophilin-like protein 1 isoform X3 [Labrus bergylta]|uniref:butyrophilin-like protein 1 isoform X3 n=1 Tax=Labrus bergylta TaxID=56723 RepID=UPI003313E2B2